MTFVIQEVVSTQKTFFGVMFIFILSALFFGGIFSPTIRLDENNKLITMDGKYFDNLKDGKSAGLLKP